MKKERKKIKFNIKDKLKFKKDNTIKAEKSKFVLTKEACIILFVIISLLIFNSVLFVSKIIPYEEYNSIEFLAIVFLNPIVLIVFGFIYSFNYGFSWFLPAILTASFLPSIISFLTPSFAFYLPIYFIFVIASELCGVSIIRIKKD
jgi:hypothetical protein